MKKFFSNKKIILALAVVACLLLAVLVPIPLGTCDDGGTRVYGALAYKIVVWNRLVAEVNGEGGIDGVETYRNTSVFWFPDSRKDIDELWEIERSRR